MRLANPRRAEHKQRVAVRHPPRRRQLPHLVPVNVRLRLEVEVGELPPLREARDLQRLAMRRSSFRETSRSTSVASDSRSASFFSAASSSRLSELVADRGQPQPRQPVSISWSTPAIGNAPGDRRITRRRSADGAGIVPAATLTSGRAAQVVEVSGGDGGKALGGRRTRANRGRRAGGWPARRGCRGDIDFGEQPDIGLGVAAAEGAPGAAAVGDGARGPVLCTRRVTCARERPATLTRNRRSRLLSVFPGGIPRTVPGSRPRTRSHRPGSAASGRAGDCRPGTHDLVQESAGRGCRVPRSSSDDPGPGPFRSATSAAPVNGRATSMFSAWTGSSATR